MNLTCKMNPTCRLRNGPQKTEVARRERERERRMARVHFPVEECSRLVTTRIDISGRGMQKSKSGIRMEFRFKAKKWDSCFGSIVSPIVSISTGGNLKLWTCTFIPALEQLISTLAEEDESVLKFIYRAGWSLPSHFIPLPQTSPSYFSPRGFFCCFDSVSLWQVNSSPANPTSPYLTHSGRAFLPSFLQPNLSSSPSRIVSRETPSLPPKLADCRQFGVEYVKTEFSLYGTTYFDIF